MPPKITPLTIILGTFATWTLYWTLERMYLYSHPTPETMVNASIWMPSDAPDDWKAALGGAMSLMYAPDREFMSRVVHVQLSGVMAICCLVNLFLGDDVAALSIKERAMSRKASIHRFTGRVFQSCVIPWSLYLNYTLFVHGMINFVSTNILCAAASFIILQQVQPPLTISHTSMSSFSNCTYFFFRALLWITETS